MTNQDPIYAHVIKLLNQLTPEQTRAIYMILRAYVQTNEEQKAKLSHL